ncbi:MAG: TauD/TfdA family dioxygenase [Leptolyngbyaceae cyanobacterium CRU_2_3]|nr:TauD/TfdA family dioxygenase [Leptolyngbyaceae cyanobacterium CRU_2_3]
MSVIAPAERIGFELIDMDVAAIAPEAIETIRQLVYQHKLVVFRNQKITTEQYVEFAKKIGTPQIYFQDNYHHPDYPEIFVSSNVLVAGKKIGVAGTGRYWHTDCAFQPEPLPMTMLYPQVLPQSIRETYYIDMHQVYKNLPPDLQRYVEGQNALHEAKWRYKVQEWDIDRAIIDILNDFEQTAPPTTHPAVITHPVNHQRSLYISQGFTTKIANLGYEESKEVLDQLFAFIERDEHIHTHIWKEGDILLWDNRTLLHKASTVPKGEPSVSHRIGIYDGLPFYVA